MNEGFGKDFYRNGNSVKRSGHSVNRRTLKTKKLLSKSTSQKSAPTAIPSAPRICPAVSAAVLRNPGLGALQMVGLVAQCSATPASVAATRHPPVARHLSRGSLTCDAAGSSRATGATGPFRRGCSAILALHLKNPRILRKSAATRA